MYYLFLTCHSYLIFVELSSYFLIIYSSCLSNSKFFFSTDYTFNDFTNENELYSLKFSFDNSILK